MNQATKDILIAQVNDLDSKAFAKKQEIDRLNTILNDLKNSYDLNIDEMNQLKQDLEAAGLQKEDIFNNGLSLSADTEVVES